MREFFGLKQAKAISAKHLAERKSTTKGVRPPVLLFPPPQLMCVCVCVCNSWRSSAHRYKARWMSSVRGLSRSTGTATAGTWRRARGRTRCVGGQAARCIPFSCIVCVCCAPSAAEATVQQGILGAGAGRGAPDPTRTQPRPQRLCRRPQPRPRASRPQPRRRALPRPLSRFREPCPSLFSSPRICVCCRPSLSECKPACMLPSVLLFLYTDTRARRRSMGSMQPRMMRRVTKPAVSMMSSLSHRRVP